MYKPSIEEFRAEMKRKGWSRALLAERWDKTERWISKIVNDADRAQQWNDALAGLPKKGEQ